MTAIELHDVTFKSRKYGAPELEDVNLTVPDGSMLTVLGPNGAGKSTLMRLLSGLEYPTDGDVLFDDIVVNAVSSRDRDVASVAEDFPLVPHHKGRSSLAFPAKLGRQQNRSEITAAVDEVTDELGLHEVAKIRPRAMRDAERQLVALGAALVREANLYLLDEPFSALDQRNRGHIRSSVANRQQRLERTTIISTSDPAEAMALGVQVAILHQGIVHQTGSVREIHANPANLFVAAFFGSEPMNLISGTVQDDTLELALGTMPLPSQLSGKNGDTVIVGFRPSDCQPVRFEDAGLANAGSSQDLRLAGTVGEIQWLGSMQRLLLGFNLDEQSEILFAQIEDSVQYTMFQPYVTVQADAAEDISLDEGLELLVPSERVMLFDPLSGDRL